MSTEIVVAVNMPGTANVDYLIQLPPETDGQVMVGLRDVQLEHNQVSVLTMFLLNMEQTMAKVMEVVQWDSDPISQNV